VGTPGLIGSLVFGGLGVGIHLAAVTTLRHLWDQSIKRLAVGFVAGMILRVAGAIGAFVAVTVAPSVFAPLPTLFGYLVVIIPLLFMEIRFLR